MTAATARELARALLAVVVAGAVGVALPLLAADPPRWAYPAVMLPMALICWVSTYVADRRQAGHDGTPDT